MLTLLNSPRIDAALNADLAILNSLAHIGWLNTQQLQVLCFPSISLSTVRNRLRYLEEASWVQHVRWRIGPSDGGQNWSITRQGIQIITRYVRLTHPPILTDLGRPSSPLEQEEWRVHFHSRKLVVRLILEARSTALLSGFTVRLPHHSLPNEFQAKILEPDIELAISWQPASIKPGNWLPWPAPSEDDALVTRYAIYLERRVQLTHPNWWTDIVRPATDDPHCIPVIAFQHSECYAQAQKALTISDTNSSVRIGTWSSCETELVGGAWRVQDTLHQAKYDWSTDNSAS